MNTIRNAIESVRSVVSDALSMTPTEPIVTLSEIIELEEAERAYRVADAKNGYAHGNAKTVSSLISSLEFPYFKGGLNRGFKRHTRQAEETERYRVLASKQEFALRKNNGRLISAGLNALGWPFIRNASGPKYILTDAQKLLEEEEREARIANKEGMMTARNNAALVSNLIRWDNYQRHTTAGAKRMTKNLEEKERRSRLTDKAEQERAADLAFQTSGLIRRLGWPFYVQPVYDNKDYTKSLEEEERNLRLINPHERQLAKENSGLVAELVNSKNPTFLEEKEKERRIQDELEQERAKIHSKQICRLIGNQFAPDEVERRRLLSDKGQIRAKQLGAKQVADIVPRFISIPAWSINRAVEKERARKLNDITGLAFSKHNSNKVAQLILDADHQKKTAWTNELEQERIRRMHDRAASDLAKKNARKVSKMILRDRSGSLNATESERARRIADLNEQERHREAAKKLSDMIALKNLPVASASLVGEATRSIPTSMLEPIVPVPASVPQDLPATSLAKEPVITTRSVSLPEGYPVEQTSFYPQQMLPQQIVPQQMLPQQMLPQQMLPQQMMPQQMLPQQMVPQQMLPQQMVPQQTYYTSPSVPVSTYYSPSSLAQPVYTTSSFSPLSMQPMTYTTAPLNGTYFPGALPATVPYDSAVPSHLRVMTDKERRMLEKQATKHSRTATREARRAEHDLAKAEKLHFKGKDSRALKYETKAEQHNVAAKHHQAWGQELAKDSLSHTLPAALPTVYRPAM